MDLGNHRSICVGPIPKPTDWIPPFLCFIFLFTSLHISRVACWTTSPFWTQDQIKRCVDSWHVSGNCSNWFLPQNWRFNSNTNDGFIRGDLCAWFIIHHELEWFQWLPIKQSTNRNFCGGEVGHGPAADNTWIIASADFTDHAHLVGNEPTDHRSEPTQEFGWSNQKRDSTDPKNDSHNFNSRNPANCIIKKSGRKLMDLMV